MVRHIVCWNYKDNFSNVENEQNGAIIKERLENLKSKIDGIISIKVCNHPLASSNCDIMLSCLFESQEALDAYQVHEEHVKVASFIKRVTMNRYCIDYIEEQ